MEKDAGPPHLEPEISNPEEPPEIVEKPGEDEKSSDSVDDNTVSDLATEDLPPVLENVVETNEAEPISEENSTASEASIGKRSLLFF